MTYIPAEIIKSKRKGRENSDDEIRYFIESYTSGELPDYQMAAWIMAICFQGMSDRETATLTAAMKNSGDTFDFSHLKFRVDKHSTGGVGDKTSLILAPIAAAAGVHVPMIAGRGLGHTGGTLDKLASIPGFTTNINENTFNKYVSEHRLALIQQTKEICPADRKLYALRDVTGTIDSLPLICGSIMSKKLAEDLTGLVLDVKYGSGAFMKTLQDAEELAKLLKTTGERNKVKVAALITSMEQPIGRFAGNSLEVKECLDILTGKSGEENGFDFYADTRDLSLILAGYMIYLAGLVPTPDAGLEVANEKLVSGEAYKEFEKLCQRQGGGDISALPFSKHKLAVLSPKNGVISKMNTEQLGLTAVQLGAGRKHSDDEIDYTAGIEFNCKLGFEVQKGEPLAFLYGENTDLFEEASKMFLEAVEISPPNTKVETPPLIAKVLDP